MEDGIYDEENNILAMGQAVELDDDKHRKKWEKYKEERDILVSSEFTVECKAPAIKKIDIGIRVKERYGEKREGIVVGSSPDERKWSIQYDNCENAEHDIPSARLKCLKDKRVYRWKAVRDSYPTRGVSDFHDNSVIGFDFKEFENTRLQIENKKYSLPYLRLLIHLWPGM